MVNNDNKSNSVQYDIDSVAKKIGVSVTALKKVIDKFLTSIVDIQLKDLSDSIGSADFQKICDDAHKFKSAALELRFNNLAELLLELEMNSEKKISMDYDDALIKVKNEIEILQKYFQANTGMS